MRRQFVAGMLPAHHPVSLACARSLIAHDRSDCEGRENNTRREEEGADEEGELVGRRPVSFPPLVACFCAVYQHRTRRRKRASRGLSVPGTA